MSDTKKMAQPAPEGLEHVREASQATVDSTVRTSKEAMGRGRDVFDRSADAAQNIGATVVDHLARGAETAVDLAQRSAEQSNDVVRLGMRTAAGVNGRFADVGYDQGHRTLESTARALDTYRQANESAAEKVQTLFAAYQQLGRGVQEMQVAYLQILGRSLHQSTHKPQDLLRAKSIEEFAEVQRDLYLSAVNLAFEAGSTLLQMTGRIAQQAMPQLQDHTKILRS